VLPTLFNLVEGAKERRAARRGDAPVDPGPSDPTPGDGGVITAPQLRRRRRG
jgi:HAE1 family hydrophobic/amphiphilic exporter-1